MQYMYMGVILGNEISALNYLENAGMICLNLDEKADWEYEFTYDDNSYNISFIVPSLKDMDYEDTIQMADFFVYFLNPNEPQEFDLFNDIHLIIERIKPRFKGFIIFRDESKLIKADSAKLLKNCWEKYPYEPFISNITTTNQLKYLIFLLSQAIKNDQIVFNPYTAWQQVFVLKKRIVECYKEKQIEKAAFLLEKVTTILKFQNNQEWQIWAEITAQNYNELKNYLKAATIIKEFNPIYAQTNKEKYFSNLIATADNLFADQKFEEAAEKYEFAARWAKFELEHKNLEKDAFNQAINAWIKATEFQNVMSIIDNLEHKQKITTLEKITDDIIKQVEILEKRDNLQLAKAQLYLCFQRYQKMGLFDSLKILANKTVSILKQIIEDEIAKKNHNLAQLTLDELENIWDSYDIKESNIDHLLYDLAMIYLDNTDFQKVDLLIPKITSIKLKNDLANLRVNREEKLQNEQKIDKLTQIKESLEILDIYVQFEQSIFENQIKTIQDEVEDLLNKQKYEHAIQKIEEKCNWLLSMNKNRLSSELFMKVLDVYLILMQPNVFLNKLESISEKYQKKYIDHQHHIIFSSFKSFEGKIEKNGYIQSLNAIIKKYRNHLLYEKAKMYAELLINYLFQMTLNELKNPDIKNIKNALLIVSQIKDIMNRNFDEEFLNFDIIYEKIVKYFINQEDLQSARKYNQKIKNLTVANQYNDKIEEIEARISQIKVQKAAAIQNVKIESEKLSQLKNEARDQNLASENMFKMRLGLKRRFFDPILQNITENKFLDAANEYFIVSENLCKTKKYQLSGLSASLGGLLYLLMKNSSKIPFKLAELRKNLGQSESYFNETFPVKLLDYLIKMMEINNFTNFREGLKLFTNMPLFPEEKTILETMIGDPIDFKSILDYKQRSTDKTDLNLPNNVNILLNEISFNPEMLTKRKALEGRYWSDCKTYFTHQNYNAAANAYLANIKDLFNREVPEIIQTTIVMSFFSSIQNKNIDQIYAEFEKFIFKLEKIDENVVRSPIIVLLDYVLQFWEIPEGKSMIQEIIKGLRDNLPLFSWEISYLNGLLNSISEDTEKINETNTRETTSQTKQGTEQNTLLIQQADVLINNIKEKSDEFTNILEKRSKMVRTYYADILQALYEQNFEIAKKNYVKLANRMARRNDFITASLMILLTVLVQFQQKIALKEIKAYLDDFLQNMGIIKDILYDQIGIKVAYFLINSLNYDDSRIKQKINEILSQLPILDEEKIIFP